MKNEKMSFKDARDFARALGINSKKSWFIFKKDSDRQDVPWSPEKFYKNEWISWFDWLGYDKRIMPQGFNRTRKINEDFFKIWSSDMSYILGFWFADGCISNEDCFSFSQHKKDKYILYNIREKLKSQHRISKSSKKGNNFVLNIYSKEIVKDIKKIGGKERKSLDMMMPDIPCEYLPDFIRGYFDGDGCIFCDKKNKKYASTFVSGSKNFIEMLFGKLKILGINGGSIYSFKNKKYENFYYRIYFNKHDTIKLGKIMYYNEDIICLRRKKDLFESIESKEEEDFTLNS